MARLIRDLLDSASMDAGGFSLQLAPQDVNAILREGIEMMEPSASQKGIQLEGVFLEAPLELRCDRARMIQVLANLVNNAIKFTQEGSVRVGVERLGEELRFEVRDSGSGIPAEELPHVFDRYWKGPHSDRAGHGLGLHIARKLVEAHSGRIWAESVAGKGSAFFFTVPLRA
jgi:signal transduction histidine kinase